MSALLGFSLVPFLIVAGVFFAFSSGVVKPKISIGETPRAAAQTVTRKDSDEKTKTLRIAAPSPLPAPVPVVSPTELPDVSARASLIMDMRSGATLYQSEINRPVSIASLTKLATALAAVQTRPDWEQQVQIESTDLKNGGIEYFIPGESYTLRDLLYTMLVGSSNTAAYTLARATGADLNKVAATLSLKNTRFVEPTGLDEKNVSTAYEIGVLARTAFAEPLLKNILVLPEYKLGERIVRSTDALLFGSLARPPFAVLAGKTGSLGGDIGYHLATVVDRDGAGAVLVIVLGATTPGGRFDDAEKLARWAFLNYRWEGYADRD